MSQSVNVNYEIATIANGATDSGWVDLKGKQLVAVVFPAAWTGTASIKFRGRYLSTGNGNIIAEKKSSTDYSCPVTVNEWVPLDVDVFCGAGQIQLVAASSQGAERQVVLITRPVG